jgi:hypothetical protein
VLLLLLLFLPIDLLLESKTEYISTLTVDVYTLVQEDTKTLLGSHFEDFDTAFFLDVFCKLLFNVKRNTTTCCTAGAAAD